MNFSNRKERIAARLRHLHAQVTALWLRYVTSAPLEISSLPLVVLAPHQDDETFGCGGLIALKRRAGIPVTVLFITDGAKSHWREGASAEELVRVRQSEAIRAAKALGLTRNEIHFLNYPDLGLSSLPDDVRDKLVDEIASHLPSSGPAELLLPHQFDRHPDHEATYRLGVDAAARSSASASIYQYTVWMSWTSKLSAWLRIPTLRGACRLTIQDVLMAKRRAIDVYRSQLDVLPTGFRELFDAPIEIFFPVPPIDIPSSKILRSQPNHPGRSSDISTVTSADA